MTPPTHDPKTIESQYGRLETDCSLYQPLDRLNLRVTGRAGGDSHCSIQVCDPLQRGYARLEVELSNNQGDVTFPVAGRLGVHYIYMYFPGETRWSRYINFEVSCESGVQTGDPDFDRLYPFTREHMRLGRREYDTPRGKFVGYRRRQLGDRHPDPAVDDRARRVALDEQGDQREFDFAMFAENHTLDICNDLCRQSAHRLDIDTQAIFRWSLSHRYSHWFPKTDQQSDSAAGSMPAG